MSLNDDDNNTNTADTLYSDESGKVPIAWDKNTASILGTLIGAGRALRNQHPDIYRLITTNTVEERGITYIDNPAIIDILEKPELAELRNAHSFAEPCPATPARIKDYNTGLVLLAKPEFKFRTTSDGLSDAQLRRYSFLQGPADRLRRVGAVGLRGAHRCRSRSRLR